jgi:predicted Zn-dependent protease
MSTLRFPQAAYRYREPVSLPAGSTVSLRHVYDNSADNPVMHNALSEFLLAQGRRAEAENAFVKAVRSDPNQFHSHVQLGLVGAQLGKLELAKSAILRSLEIRPGDPEARQLLEQVEARIAGKR